MCLWKTLPPTTKRAGNSDEARTSNEQRREVALVKSPFTRPCLATGAWLLALVAVRGHGAPETPATIGLLCNNNLQTAIGLVDEENALIRGDGALLEPGGEVGFHLVSHTGKTYRNRTVSQSLVEGRYPVVTTKLTAGEWRYGATAFTAPLAGKAVDVVWLSVTKAASEPVSLVATFAGDQVQLAGPTGLRLGERTVRWDRGARLESVPKTWGYDPDPNIQGLRHWAHPQPHSDPAFANVRAGFLGKPLIYHFAVPSRASVPVAVGLCEGYWNEAGQRVVTLKVEGARRRTVDTVKDAGRNVPQVLLFTGRDEDGDGRLDVTCSAAPEAKDQNCILNTIWILKRPFQPGDRERLLAHAGDLPLLYGVDCGGWADQSFTPTPQLVWELSRTDPPTTCRWVAVDHVPGSTPPRFTPASLEAARAAAVEYWKAVYNRGVQLHIANRDVEDLFYMSLANLFLLRDRQDGVVVVKPGETCYDSFWYRDGAYMVLAQDVAGFAHEAEDSLELFWRDDLPDSVRHWGQKPDGAWAVPPNEWDGQGQALWALWRHYRLTGDKAWLEKTYPAVLQGARWIHAARLRTKVKGGHAGAPLSFGLFPKGFGERIDSQRAFVLYHDFWGVLGARCAWQIAKALGRPDAAWMKREYLDFRTCVLRCCDRASAQNPRGYLLPGALGRPQALIWGGIAAVYPSEALPVHAPVVDATFRVMEQRSVEGQYRFLSEEKIWPYYSTDWARAYLYREEYAKALRLFRSYVGHASPTRAWIEEIFIETRRGTGDMPHGWAAADYVMLLRDLLLLERGDALHVCPAADADWLPPGENLGVTGAPTCFGKVTFTLERPDRRSLVYTFRSKWRQPPARIVFHPPVGTQTEGITVDSPVAGVEGATVVVSGAAVRKSPLRIRIAL